MVAIVIPAYKRKECLRKTLFGLTLQTKKSFYVVVVDDHSPEPLIDVVNEFKYKMHIKYIYLQKNGGPGVARQAGLEYCYEQGFEFVMFLDSDDYLFPHAVARLSYEISTNKANIVSSVISLENSMGIKHEIAETNKTFIHGKIYRTSFLKDNNITFPPFRTNEDLAFNLKAFEITDKIIFLKESFHLFHNDKSSITRSGENLLSLEIDYIGAIYDSAIFLYENHSLTKQIFNNIIHCYNCYQIFLLMNGNLSEEREFQMRWLLNLKEFQEFMSNKTFLSEIPNFIQQNACIDGKLIQFKQTFEEWLKEFSNACSDN